jgi:hypothetical protein
VAAVARIAGEPESSTWEANWCGFPIDFLGGDDDDDPPTWRGNGRAEWKNVSEATRAALFSDLGELWTAESLYIDTQRLETGGEVWVSLGGHLDDPGTQIVALSDIYARHVERARTLVLSTGVGLGRCYSWDELRSTRGDSE